MGTAERRKEIIRILCRRRYETVSNLAKEFGVSTRTILRDIAVLSTTEPIYTQCGRYGGGVYILDNYQMDRMYMTEGELNVLIKVFNSVKEKRICELNPHEEELLGSVISNYTKPNN